MSQHLVDVVEEAQAWRRGLQPVQPQRVPAHPQEVSRVPVDQVVTVMSRSSLKVREGDLRGPAGAVNQGDASGASTHHDGDVMAVWQREGPVHVQDVVLCAQEALQVLRVRGHLLGHGVHAPCADQSLGEEQRHALLLPVHHHLRGTDGRFKKIKGQSGFTGGSRSFGRTTTAAGPHGSHHIRHRRCSASSSGGARNPQVRHF